MPGGSMPTVVGMRTAAAATALGITLMAAGLVSCSDGAGPPVTPAPAPSGTPVFASDEEALAAAEEVYGRYLEVSNAVGAAGWTDTEPLEEVLRAQALEDELASANAYEEAGLRQEGRIDYDTATLQQYSAEVSGAVSVSVYLCIDVSAVDLIDAEGQSVVPAGRIDRQPVEVTIDDVDGTLKISGSEAWSGASFC